MSVRVRSLCVYLVLTILATAPVVAEVEANFEIETLVISGQTISGLGTITFVNDQSVNDAGDWAVLAVVNGSDLAILKNGAALVREGDLIQERTLSFFELIGLRASGELVWLGYSAQEDCIYVDLDPVLCAQDQVRPIIDSGGQGLVVWNQFDSFTMNAAGELILRARITPVPGESLVRVVPAAPFYQTEVLVSVGDTLTGETEPIATFGGLGPHRGTRTDSESNVVAFLYPGPRLCRNLECLVQRGDPSPVPGRTYSSLGSGVSNARGDLAFHGLLDLQGGPNRSFIELNSEIYARQGDTDFTPGGFPFVGVGGILWLDDHRNLLHRASWNDGISGVDEGLFMNDVVLTQTTVTVLESSPISRIMGMVEIDNRTGWVASQESRYVAFEAGLADGREGVFRISIAPPSVPDGRFISGTSMTAARLPGGSVQISWDVTCGAPQYNLFYGSLDSIAQMTYDGEVCNLGTFGEMTFDPPSGNVFWIVAGSDPATGLEGAHGFDSEGIARPLTGEGRCGIAAQIRTAACEP